MDALATLLGKNLLQIDLTPDNIMLHYQKSENENDDEDPRIDRELFYE